MGFRMLFGGDRHSPSCRINYAELAKRTAKQIEADKKKEKKRQLEQRCSELERQFAQQKHTCAYCNQSIECDKFKITRGILAVDPFNRIPPQGTFLFKCGCSTQKIEYEFTHERCWELATPAAFGNYCNSCLGLIDGVWHKGDELVLPDIFLHEVFELAYRRWYTQAAEAERKGDTHLIDELDTTMKELMACYAPVAFSEGKGINI